MVVGFDDAVILWVHCDHGQRLAIDRHAAAVAHDSGCYLLVLVAGVRGYGARVVVRDTDNGWRVLTVAGRRGLKRDIEDSLGG